MDLSKMKSALLFTMSSLLGINFSIAEPVEFALVGFGSKTTGGSGGTEITVNSLSQLISEAGSAGKKIIKIGQTFEASGTIIEVSNDKTILGIGDKAFLKGIGFHLKNVHNVIIRNLKMTMIGGGAEDIISGETTSDGTGGDYWIDHCEFFNERPTLPESASKKDKYDGIIDFKKQVSNITISWNYIHDHWKCSLTGFSSDKDSYDRKITYHHNWFKDIKSRTPSYRAGTGHVYNNFYDGLNDPESPTSDGINARDASCIFVEGNYFLNYAKTIYWAKEDSPTEGKVNESGAPNIFDNSPPNTAAACDSFTPSYNAKVDPAEIIPGLVKTYSGIGKLDLATVGLATDKPSPILFPRKNGAIFEVLLPGAVPSTTTIFTLTGKRIKEIDSNQPRVSLNLENFKNGIYLAIISYQGRTFRHILLKK